MMQIVLDCNTFANTNSLKNVKQFQVFLSNINNSICTLSNGSKYCKGLNISTYLIEETLTDTTTSSQRRPASNDKRYSTLPKLKRFGALYRVD